jgi:hypothetical protein
MINVLIWIHSGESNTGHPNTGPIQKLDKSMSSIGMHSNIIHICLVLEWSAKLNHFIIKKKIMTFLFIKSSSLANNSKTGQIVWFWIGYVGHFVFSNSKYGLVQNINILVLLR